MLLCDCQFGSMNDVHQRPKNQQSDEKNQDDDTMGRKDSWVCLPTEEVGLERRKTRHASIARPGGGRPAFLRDNQSELKRFYNKPCRALSTAVYL